MRINNQKGFAAVEAILILVIVAMIAGVGYYVWHSNQQTKATLDEASKSAQNSLAKTTKKPTSVTQYLAIKEWGVKIPLTSDILDSYYVTSNQDSPVPSQISLSLNSLKSTQCKADGWSPSIYFRYTNKDTDPISGELYTQKVGTKHKIGSYYYAYEDGNGVAKDGGCQSTVTDQAKANAAATAFKTALDSIQAQ